MNGEPASYEVTPDPHETIPETDPTPESYPSTWVLKQAAGALVLAGWNHQESRGCWVSPDGEIIAGDVLSVIDVLAGCKLARRDSLLDFAQGLGALVESIG